MGLQLSQHEQYEGQCPKTRINYSSVAAIRSHRMVEDLRFPHLGDTFSSVAQSCPTLCDPMDCSTLGFPVHQQLPELAQIHVH